MNHESDPDAPPRALDLLPILIVALVLAPLAWWLTRSTVTWPVFIGFAVASAGLLGLPMLFWALDHRWTRLTSFVLLGACAGAMPMVAVLASGVLGRLMRGGVSYVERVLSRGAPIPMAGLLTWPEFARAEIQGVIFGAVCAAIYWRLIVRRR